jgi:hypothetical protein
MSNVPTTTKAIIAIVSTIILASGIFVMTKSRPVETPSIATSSSSVYSLISSTSKAALSLSSQSQTVSSSSQAVSKTVEVTKPSEVATVPQPQTQCNQTDSPDLVKTEDGCFSIEYIYADGSIFKNSNLSDDLNKDKFFDTESNRNLVKLVSTDYYKKIKSKFVSPFHKIATIDSKKLSNNEFSLSLIISDQDYNKRNNLIGYVPVCQYNYNIKLTPKLEFNTISTNKDSYCS